MFFHDAYVLSGNRAVTRVTLNFWQIPYIGPEPWSTFTGLLLRNLKGPCTQYSGTWGLGNSNYSTGLGVSIYLFGIWLLLRNLN